MAVLPAAEGTLMKRWVGRVLLFLLIGAVVNVAVAWAFELPTAPDYSGAPGSSFDLSEILPDCFMSEHRQPGMVVVSFLRNPGVSPAGLGSGNLNVAGIAAALASKQPGWGRFAPGAAYTPPAGTPYWVWSRSTGWPAPAMVRFALQSNGVDRPLDPLSSGLTLTRASQGRTARVLPLLPLWPGFIANSIVFAVAAGLLAFSGQVRRWHRAHRNLCPNCAYPVGTSPVCTECGKPVRPRGATA